MYVIYPLVSFPAGRDCKGKKFHRKTPAGIFYKASNFAQKLDFLHGALKITLSCITYKNKSINGQTIPKYCSLCIWFLRQLGVGDKSN